MMEQGYIGMEERVWLDGALRLYYGGCFDCMISLKSSSIMEDLASLMKALTSDAKISLAPAKYHS